MKEANGRGGAPALMLHRPAALEVHRPLLDVYCFVLLSSCTAADGDHIARRNIAELVFLLINI